MSYLRPLVAASLIALALTACHKDEGPSADMSASPHVFSASNPGGMELVSPQPRPNGTVPDTASGGASSSHP